MSSVTPNTEDGGAVWERRADIYEYGSAAESGDGAYSGFGASTKASRGGHIACDWL